VSMEVDRDEKTTQEELKARDEENRAREKQEQAGMRIIFCEPFYLIISSSSSIFMDARIRRTRHNRACTTGYTRSRSDCYYSEKETVSCTERP
jgi:hypothetical protein